MSSIKLSREYYLLGISLWLAFSLAILPLPLLAKWMRPDWVFLMVCYWVLWYPDRYQIGFAWCVGLLQDVLTGSLLGVHAFGFTLVAYILARWHRQIQMFPLWQQASLIGSLALLIKVLTYLLLTMTSPITVPGLYWVSPFITALLWIWVSTLLRTLIQPLDMTA